MTSSQRLDQGSTLFEQLRSTVASVHFTSVYKLPPCVGHTKPFKKVPIFVCTKSSPFYSFFSSILILSVSSYKGNCACVDHVLMEKTSTPRTQKIILTVQNRCVQYWRMQ